MSTFEEMIQKDLQLMWSIQSFCHEASWLSETMNMITNKNPLKDIVIVIWLLFIIGVIEFGQSHFWVVILNLVVSFGLQKLLEVKRPVEYDIRLQPLTDINAESYGFPSLESYMSVVILGHMILSLKSALFLPVALLIIFVVGFSRVYSRSRFPHQIVGSWLLGIVGLALSMHCCERMSFHSMSRHEHGVCIGFVVLGVLCNAGLAMENNDSRLVRVPKSEFVRVMGDIVSGGATAAVATSTTTDFEDGSRGSAGEAAREILLERSRGEVGFGDDDGDDEEGYYPASGALSATAGQVKESPRSTAMRYTQQASVKLQSRQRAKHAKSDSLYFLQRSIQEREAGIKASIEQQQSSSNGGLANPVRRRFLSRRDDSVSSGADDGSFTGYGKT